MARLRESKPADGAEPDIADLLREVGRERRRLGEDLMRLFEGSDGSEGDDEEERDQHLN